MPLAVTSRLLPNPISRVTAIPPAWTGRRLLLTSFARFICTVLRQHDLHLNPVQVRTSIIEDVCSVLKPFLGDPMRWYVHTGALFVN
jgi:hypothetical protein